MAHDNVQLPCVRQLTRYHESSVKTVITSQDRPSVIEPSPVRIRTVFPPFPRRPLMVLLLSAPVTFETVMSCTRIVPSPVCASSSPLKPSGSSSITEPSPVWISQSELALLPDAA